jgi:hypothetical protein
MHRNKANEPTNIPMISGKLDASAGVFAVIGGETLVIANNIIEVEGVVDFVVIFDGVAVVVVVVVVPGGK